MRTLGIATAIALSLPASPKGAQAIQRLIDLRQIPTDTLRDVAIATFEHGRPVIYYNPRLLQQFGPQLTTFFFAHEYGHIYYGHTGAALLQAHGELTALRQQQELEADCYATAILADHDRAAVEAAIRFFTRLGPYRYDAYHPTGSQRAAKMLACLPEPEVTASVDEEPSSAGPARSATFTVRTPEVAGGAYGVEARIWIDDAPVGVISSLRQPGRVEIRRFAAGAHRYRVTVQLYTFDALLQLNPSGTVSGDGLVNVRDGDTFAVQWSEGRPPVLIRQ
jgi:hypothetical protein